MEYELTKELVNEALERVDLKLHTLISIAYEEEDSRKDLLEEKLSHESYGLAIRLFNIDGQHPNEFLQKDGTVFIDEERLSSWVSYMCGRVLTYIDLSFSQPHQCAAFKSLASDAVWDFMRHIRESVPKKA